jgi:hypothetical protein
MEMKTKKTMRNMPLKKKEPITKTFEPMMPKRPMMKLKDKIGPAKENPTKKEPTSTTTTTPAPRLKKAEADPSFFERAKSGLKSLMPQPGKLSYNEDTFEPEKKMVGKAQRGVKSYLRGSMGKGGM